MRDRRGRIRLAVLCVPAFAGLLIASAGRAQDTAVPAVVSPDSVAFQLPNSLRVARENRELEEFAAMLAAEEPMVRLRAVKGLAGSLGGLSDPNAGLELLEAARSDPDIDVATQAEVSLTRLRMRYSEGLGAVERPAMETSADLEARRLARELRDQRELEEYAVMLGSLEPMVRLRAVKGLAGSLGGLRVPTEALALLEAARWDRDLDVATQAEVSLARWSLRDSEATGVAEYSVTAKAVDREAHRLAAERQELEEYAAMLTSTDPMVRLRAVKGLAGSLGSMSDPPAALALLEAARSDTDIDVATQARVAVKRLAGRYAVESGLRQGVSGAGRGRVE